MIMLHNAWIIPTKLSNVSGTFLSGHAVNSHTALKFRDFTREFFITPKFAFTHTQYSNEPPQFNKHPN